MQKNHINRVLLHFSFAQEEKDTALLQTKKIFYDDTLPLINVIFDKTEKNIYIDKLEIDVGKITESEFPEKFSAALTEALSKLSFQTIPQNKLEPKAGFSADENTGLLVEDLIFFLKSGYWPWYVQRKPEEEIRGMLIAFWERKELVFQLFSKISADHAINIQRITYLAAGSKELKNTLYEAFLMIHPYLKEILLFFGKVYSKVIAGEQYLNAAFINKLYRYKPLETPGDFKNFIAELLEKNLNNSIKLPLQVQQAAGSVKQLLRQQDVIIKDKLLPLLEKLFSIGNKFYNAAESANPSNYTTFQPGAEEDKISITNAGLILLHPYLPFMFRELGWVDEGKNFIDQKAQQKAILFLQFLINGKSSQAEHLLVLNKILCGWPIDLPLDIKRYQFTEAEKKEGKEMLDSLIEHWSALKNTSRDGLINSFITRNGLLQKREDGFLVQVEKSSIDILIEFLPFGILTIKLPWNEYIIYTEWTY
ncbi:contractile injection system tape measure protein [Mucilaginibacter sp.]|jgi:hypothetical protein|uniref:contractile injection system tape measure protein n=1 Tax=Mucilaginibacter sp. TaxID=1882438 RepID=UPI002BB3AE96|nr:contractile injection system tape measure protein [Mucilaginibacter sp.]HTI61068.1 contractile injection system tape measure protein [Mucilaginibacter sp.]